MVLLEIQFLYEVGRIKMTSRDVRRKLTFELGIKVCELPLMEVTDVALSEHWTRDPFDRMVVAQAKANGLATLVSSDRTIRKNYSRTVW